MLPQVLTYVPTIIGLVCICSVILSRHPRTVVNWLFAGFIMSLAAWEFSLFIGDLNLSYTSSLWAVRMALFTGMPFGLLFLLFSMHFPVNVRQPTKLFYVASIVPTVLFMILSLTPYSVPAIAIVGHSAQPIQLNWIYSAQNTVLLGYLLSGFLFLANKLRRVNPQQRNQIRWVLFSILFSFLVNATGGFVLTIVGLSNDYTNFAGCLAVLVMASAIAYAIGRHRLFDVRPLVARALAYVLAIGTLGGAYGIVLFSTIPMLTANTSKLQERPFEIAAAVFFGLSFQPIKRSFDKLTNKFFYRDAYDTQQVLATLATNLVGDSDVASIIESSLTIVDNALRPQHAKILVIRNGELYKSSQVGTNTQQLTKVEIDDLMQTDHHAKPVTNESAQPAIQQLMERLDYELMIPLITQEGFLGAMLFGPRRNGGPYVKQDLKLVHIFANNLSLALENGLNFEQVSHFAERLQTEVDQATTELRLTNRTLEELSLAKDEYMSMASHQLRPQLTAAQGFIELLQREPSESQSHTETDELLQLLHTSVLRMGRLVSDILSSSDPPGSQMHLHRQEFDLVQLVNQEIRHLKRYASQQRVKLLPHLPDSSVSLFADETKLREVIMNLIDNAIHYSQASSTVTVRLVSDQQKISFTVEDQGIGVPDHLQNQLFNKFFRAPNAREQRPSGTGIGLYVAKRVIEAHGGKIHYSPIEHGSRFGFYLPARAPRTDKKSTSSETIKHSTTERENAIV